MKKILFFISFLFVSNEALAKTLCPLSNSKNQTIATMAIMGCVEDDKFLQKFATDEQAQLFYNLAKKYYKGTGLPEPNFRYAANFFKKSAKLNYPKAQEKIGLLYYKGVGVSQNNLKAYLWLSLAAKQKQQKAKKALLVVKKELSKQELEKAEALIKKWEEEKNK